MRNFNTRTIRREITQEELIDLFEYRPEGLLIWKYRPDVHPSWNTKYVGTAAGGNGESGNYKTAKIDTLGFKVHRLVWIYHYGLIPDGMYVDHINQNRADDRIENLRLATHGQNLRNISRKANRLGVTGVSKDKSIRRYQARIALDGERINLGMFDTAEEAHQAYVEASIRLHGPFSPFSGVAHG